MANLAVKYLKRALPKLGRVFMTAALVATSLAGPFAPTANAATQSSYRWRNDDGSEAAATWAAAEDNAISNFTVGDTKRLRFGVAGDAGETEAAVAQSAAISSYTSASLTGVLIVDSSGTYGYAGTTDVPSRIIKVRLSDMAMVDEVALAFSDEYGYSENGAIRGVLSRDGAYAYFYSYAAANPSVLVKVRLADMARIGSLELPTANNIFSGYMATDNYGHLYVSLSGASSNKVIRVNLETFSAADTVSVTIDGVPNSQNVFMQASDVYPYLFVGSGGASGSFVGRIPLSDFAAGLDAGTIALSGTNEQDLQSVDVDDILGKIYVYLKGSTNTKIERIDVPSFAVDASVDYSSVNNRLATAVVGGQYVFMFGSNVAAIPLSSFSGYADLLTLPYAQSGTHTTSGPFIANGYAYKRASAASGLYWKISLAPHRDLRLEAAPKAGTCAATATGWAQVTAGSSPFKLTASSFVADQALTTQQLGSSPFVPGRAVTGTTASTGSLGLAAGTVSEVEYSLTPTSSATPGASYCFRVTDGGTPLATYSAVAEARAATVSANDATQTSVVGDASPSVDTVVPSDASGSGSVALPAAGFTLNEGAARTLFVRGIVSDANGCTDLTGVAVTVYRSSASGGAACTPDNNSCYAATVARSELVGCTGAGDADAAFEVTIPVANYADPTDAGSPHDADTWMASATASDAAGATGTLAADFEVQSLAALSVAPAVMDYGTVALGATSTRQALTFTNVGNRGVNSLIRADGPMRSSLPGFADIASAQTHYSVSQAAAWAAGTPVAATDTDLPLALPQQTADAGPAPTAEAYFYLRLPATGIRGTYTNTMYFTAYAN